MRPGDTVTVLGTVEIKAGKKIITHASSGQGILAITNVAPGEPIEIKKEQLIKSSEILSRLGKLRILENTIKRDQNGKAVVSGKIKNVSEEKISDIRLDITFYLGSEGKKRKSVRSQNMYKLGKGETSNFEVMSNFSIEPINSYMISGSYSTPNINNTSISNAKNTVKSKKYKRGLLACYAFNGNANDSSGNEFHGVVHGTTLIEDRFGNSNSAYNFEGFQPQVI